MQSDVAGRDGFVRGWAHGKDKTIKVETVPEKRASPDEGGAVAGFFDILKWLGVG
jgi:hypothetical protein